jgi:hypothetical protein
MPIMRTFFFGSSPSEDPQLSARPNNSASHVSREIIDATLSDHQRNGTPFEHIVWLPICSLINRMIQTDSGKALARSNPADHAYFTEHDSLFRERPYLSTTAQAGGSHLY